MLVHAKVEKHIFSYLILHKLKKKQKLQQVNILTVSRLLKSVYNKT